MSAIIDPKTYAWLDTLPAPLPRMVQEARKLLGTHEAAGSVDNPVILDWAKEVQLDNVFTADSIAWCGLFMTVVAKRAGKTPPADPLWALNWTKFGEPGGQPRLGDVLTFVRDGGGHVAMYIAEDKTTFHVLGGNQSDCVCFTRIDKARLKRVRWTPYMSRPASAQPYVLKDTGGVVSQNET